MDLYPLTRAILFRLDPERAHALSVRWMARIGASGLLRRAMAAAFASGDSEPVEAFGLSFPNRVGLAAGYDKDGEAWPGLATLGFGHIEVGTVTPLPQPGNPRPRVFRLVEQRSLINRMGFPGKGAAYVAERLARPRRKGLIIGANIGKQKDTPLEAAVADYEQLMIVLAPHADYIAVNISSPNTPGLRQLQDRSALEGLLDSLVSRRNELSDRLGRELPVLVKLAPDLDDDQLRTAVDVIVDAGIDGIIATNTTVERKGVDHPFASEEGGLSGKELGERSTKIVAKIVEQLAGALPVIGVGGIMGPSDAQEKLDAGAVLVQLYTGLVYEGPGLVKRVLQGIRS
jgi:dihydroorotate dehydrogenase